MLSEWTTLHQPRKQKSFTLRLPVTATTKTFSNKTSHIDYFSSPGMGEFDRQVQKRKQEGLILFLADEI